MGPGVSKNNINVGLEGIQGPVAPRKLSSFEMANNLVAELRGIIDGSNSKGIKVKHSTINQDGGGRNSYGLSIQVKLNYRGNLPISESLAAILRSNEYKGLPLSLTMFDQNGKLMSGDVQNRWLASLP